jgi:hypothetical protein
MQLQQTVGLVNAGMPSERLMRASLPWIDSHQHYVPANDELLMSTEWNVLI